MGCGAGRCCAADAWRGSRATPTSNELPPILLMRSARIFWMDALSTPRRRRRSVACCGARSIHRSQSASCLGTDAAVWPRGRAQFPERQLSTCSDDHKAQVVLLTAVPGVGKTRLLHEFLGRVGTAYEPAAGLHGGGCCVPQACRIRWCVGCRGSPGAAPRSTTATAVMSRPLIRKRRHRPRRPAFVCRRGTARSSRSSCLSSVAFPCARGSGEDEARVRQLLLSARREPRLMHQHLRRAFVSWLGTQCQQSAVLIALTICTGAMR